VLCEVGAAAEAEGQYHGDCEEPSDADFVHSFPAFRAGDR
jgi:hypothetical protein